MEILTSAATSMTKAAESEPVDDDVPSLCAQIVALKRKLIECDRELKSSQDRSHHLEQALDVCPDGIGHCYLMAR